MVKIEKYLSKKPLKNCKKSRFCQKTQKCALTARNDNLGVQKVSKSVHFFVKKKHVKTQKNTFFHPFFGVFFTNFFF